MRNLLAALLLACTPIAPLAQEPSAAEREAVLSVVQKFFDMLATRDVTVGGSILTPEARFVILGEPKPGEPQAVRSTTAQESLDRLGKDTRQLKERMWNPDVRIRGPLAVVWTPYDFWVDGKFSHCGVDSFNLVKTAEGWKIASLLYTVERTGCPPSPLGPLK